MSVLAIDDKTIQYNKSNIDNDETPITSRSKIVRIVEDKSIQASPIT